MKPGNDLDVLVHEHVFNACAHVFDTVGPTPACTKCGLRAGPVAPGDMHRMFVPPYSTSIQHAWLVAESLRLSGTMLAVSAQPQGWWVVNASKALNPRGDGSADGWDDTYPDTTFRVQSVPHGICLAAVHYRLPEEVINEYLLHCMFCQGSVFDGHERGCQFIELRPDLQDEFTKVHGPRGGTGK